jgi:PAS domain S-box-containing protein
VLAAVAVAAALANLLLSGRGHGDWLWAAPVVALLVAGGYLAVQFRYRDEVEALDLFEAVLALALFAFPGWSVVAMVAVANILSEGLHGHRSIKGAFNVAQWTAAAGAGTLVFSALRGGEQLTWHNVGALVAALGVVMLINHLAFATVIALAQRHSIRDVLHGLRSVIVPGWIIGGGLNLTFGLLFVAAYQWDAAAVPLFLVPVLALNWASAAYAAARADEVRLRALHRASALLGAAVDPVDAVDALLEEVRGCFEAEAAELVLIDDIGRVALRRATSELPLAAELCSTLLALTEPARLTARTAKPEGWRDCLAAPLVDAGRTIGVLCTYNRTGLEGFEDGELAVLGALAADVVAALQRGRLVQRVVEERRKLSDIVENASDGIFTVANDGTVTSWNPALEEITGYLATDVVGRADLGVLRPRDADGRDVILERWSDRAAPPTDLQVLTRAGERRWLSCSYNRAAGPGSEGDSLVVIARDVTKVREVERLRDDFVATVSHELRTPLSPIKGWASTLLEFGDKLDAGERRDALQSILRQAQRLERLVVNLLEVSKIEHGSLEVDESDVHVGSIARRVVEDFQVATPERTFELLADDRLSWARGRELWVEQILTNLLSNAVKYSPSTEGIELSVSRRNDHIEVAVADHGCGIPAHELERVFERFHRVRETTTQTGTGLGLYIARQLAAQMGGCISVDSVPGRGSRFVLQLPAAAHVVDVRAPEAVVELDAG